MSSLLDAPIPVPFSSDDDFARFLREECDFLMSGTTRKVYVVRGQPYVLKVALDFAATTSNWTEITSFLHYAKDQQKLAKIVSWSIDGKYLVMERLDTECTDRPDFEYPVWVTDRKPSNIGKAADTTYKLCDYAFVKSPRNPASSDFA